MAKNSKPQALSESKDFLLLLRIADMAIHYCHGTHFTLAVEAAERLHKEAAYQGDAHLVECCDKLMGMAAQKFPDYLSRLRKLGARAQRADPEFFYAMRQSDILPWLAGADEEDVRTALSSPDFLEAIDDYAHHLDVQRHVLNAIERTITGSDCLELLSFAGGVFALMNPISKRAHTDLRQWSDSLDALRDACAESYFNQLTVLAELNLEGAFTSLLEFHTLSDSCLRVLTKYCHYNDRTQTMRELLPHLKGSALSFYMPRFARMGVDFLPAEAEPEEVANILQHLEVQCKDPEHPEMDVLLSIGLRKTRTGSLPKHSLSSVRKAAQLLKDTGGPILDPAIDALLLKLSLIAQQSAPICRPQDASLGPSL